MALKIKKDWENCNNYDCIEYVCTIPIEKTLVYRNEYGSLHMTPQEGKRIFGIIKRHIPDTEEILYADSDVTCMGAHVSVMTKPKDIIKRENEIQECLKEAGYKVEDSWIPITIDENGWVELDNIPLDEENITKIMNLINGKTWRVEHDWHMEQVTLKVKL